MIVLLLKAAVAAIGLWTILLLWLLFTFIYKEFENENYKKNSENEK